MFVWCNNIKILKILLINSIISIIKIIIKYMRKQHNAKNAKTEITGYLMGGMGNLLFIVATCYALSKNNNSSLKFYTKMWTDSKRKNIIKYNIFKNFKSIWTNFVSPLVKSIGSVIGKIVPRITKMKSYLSKKL